MNTDNIPERNPTHTGVPPNQSRVKPDVTPSEYQIVKDLSVYCKVHITKKLPINVMWECY